MKRNSKRTKKIRNLVIVCVLTAILLSSFMSIHPFCIITFRNKHRDTSA